MVTQVVPEIIDRETGEISGPWAKAAKLAIARAATNGWTFLEFHDCPSCKQLTRSVLHFEQKENGITLAKCVRCGIVVPEQELSSAQDAVEELTPEPEAPSTEIPDEAPAEDLAPAVEETAPEEATADAQILLLKGHEISAFAGSGDRFALSMVRLMPETNGKPAFLEACDGHALIRVTVPTSEDFPSTPGAKINPNRELLIPSEDLKEAVRRMPKKRDFPLLQAVRLTHEDGTVVLSTTDGERAVDLSTKSEDLQFPNTDGVMPERDPVVQVGLGAFQLKRLAEHAVKHGAAGRDTPIRISVFDRKNVGPVRLEFAVTGDPHADLQATAIIMPMKLEKIDDLQSTAASCPSCGEALADTGSDPGTLKCGHCDSIFELNMVLTAEDQDTAERSD